MKKLMLILWCFLISNLSLAMEIKKNATKATLVIDPTERAWYNLDGQEECLRKIGLKIEHLNEPMIFVKAIKVINNHNYQIDELPNALPYSLLKGKKEGDIIHITTVDNTPYDLTCSEKSYSPIATFEGLLAYAMSQFKKRPDVHIHRLSELERAGVIVRTAMFKHQHGPNGYKFGNEFDEDDDSTDSSSSDDSDSSH